MKEFPKRILSDSGSKKWLLSDSLKNRPIRVGARPPARGLDHATFLG